MPRRTIHTTTGLGMKLISSWQVCLLALGGVLAASAQPVRADEDAVDIGSRLELFVDRHLADSLTGSAELYLQKPEPREVVLVTDAPWEGNTCIYYTVFQDGDLYRMYYRGSHHRAEGQRARPEVACYAESRDGIHWEKPKLGLFEFQGSKENNIVWDGIGTHNFTPFKDLNPEAPPEAKYKALGRGRGGLYAFQSPDAIRWKLMSDKPVITKGAFDSQNLAFWDPQIGKYREYHRTFRGVRDIQTAVSDDFLNWPDPVFLEYPGAPKEHLYTNAILPAPRAPHILLGFPTRFHPDRNSQTEPTLMASRDGVTFHRWTEALIPVTAPKDRDGNRCNYMSWGVLQLPGNDREYSVYANEAYYSGDDSRLRRFTYRVDGFVSLRASADGGELLTKPLKFAAGDGAPGPSLLLNLKTKDGGKVRVELQDAAGRPLPGFAVDDCAELQGDDIQQKVSWKGQPDLAKIAGRPIRIRFVLQDADVFSYCFR